MFLSGLMGGVERHRKAARRALMRGDEASAVDALGRLLEAAPNDVAARRQRADTSRALGRMDDAVADYQALVGAYAAAGLGLKAIACAKTILELRPAHTETQEVLASLYANQRGGRSTLPAQMATALAKAPPPVPTEPMTEEGPALDTTEALDMSQIVAESTLDGAPLVAIRIPSLPSDEGDVFELDDDVLIVESVSLEADGSALLDAALLPETPLFSGLEPAAFASTIAHVNVRRFAAGDRVVTQGSMGDSCFLIVSGKVAVELRRDGARLPLAELAEGAFFGEMALLSRTARAADVTAVETTELLELSRDAVESLAAAHPTVRGVLHQFAQQRLVQNLVDTSPLFRDLAAPVQRDAVRHFKPVEARMGEQLLREGEPGRGVYVVLAGEVEVSATDADGDWVTLKHLGPGDVFGEISALRASAATASVTALVPTRLLRLSSRAVANLGERHAGVSRRLNALMAEREAETAARLEAEAGRARLV